MALLTATSPVLAAELGSYPAFLAGADGTLDAYVVIGSDAAVSDVVGAVDLATRLAEVGETTTTQSCPGSAVDVDGLVKDTIAIQKGYIDDTFPGTIRSFHYDKLTTSTISWNGNTYDYYETIYLDDDKIYTSHDFNTAGINGTQSLVVPTNVLKYQYVFKKALNLSSKNGLGTITNPEYTYPINIQLLGKPFQIVGLGTNQVKMLAGSVGTASATTPVVYGDYSVYSDLGIDATWARVIVKDAAGNTVGQQTINQGSDYSFTSIGLTVKLTAVRALADGTVVGSDLVVGATNAVEKTYPVSCDISGTGSSDYRFPGETEWCIQASGFTDGNVAVDDKIEVVYKPTTTKYIKSTDANPAMALPNDYGMIGFVGDGWNYDTWTTLTFTPVAGKTAYWDKGMTGATNTTLAASNLNGIEIAADVPGSIVDPIHGTNAYDKVYILYNYTLENATATDPRYPVMVGFYDSINNRIAVDLTAGTGYYSVLDDANETSVYTFNFTISYSNGAARGDWHLLNVTTVLNPDLRLDMALGTTGYDNSVNLTWQPKTTSWSTTAAPEFRLGSSSSAQAEDIKVLSTDTSGVSQTVNIGAATTDVVTDSGAIVVTPATYTGSDKAMVKVPAQALYAKMYVGELGGTTEGGDVSYTSYPSVPITSAIAKLDTEMSSLKTAKNLILVGGPCINDLVAELASSGDFDYSCDSWPARDFGLITAIDDAFATGKVALVVAGTNAAETRVATSALQMYDTILDGVTAGSVEVTGTVGAPVVA